MPAVFRPSSSTASGVLNRTGPPARFLQAPPWQEWGFGPGGAQPRAREAGDSEVGAALGFGSGGSPAPGPRSGRLGSRGRQPESARLARARPRRAAGESWTPEQVLHELPVIRACYTDPGAGRVCRVRTP